MYKIYSLVQTFNYPNLTDQEKIPEFRTFSPPILTPLNYQRKYLSEVEFSIC